MSRYINRDLIVKNPMLHTWKKADLLRAIKEAPTADVVEVVRCKDCKYFTKEMIGDDLECICKCFCGMMVPASDFYCSYGERREEK